MLISRNDFVRKCGMTLAAILLLPQLSVKQAEAITEANNDKLKRRKIIHNLSPYHIVVADIDVCLKPYEEVDITTTRAPYVVVKSADLKLAVEQKLVEYKVING